MAIDSTTAIKLSFNNKIIDYILEIVANLKTNPGSSGLTGE
jgi:hypothetical protein